MFNIESLNFIKIPIRSKRILFILNKNQLSFKINNNEYKYLFKRKESIFYNNTIYIKNLKKFKSFLDRVGQMEFFKYIEQKEQFLYYKSIFIEGLGFRIFKDSEFINFELGYSHFIRLYIRKTLFNIKIQKKKKVKIFMTNRNKLCILYNLLKRLKKIDPYKGSGIFNNIKEKSLFKLKSGKIRA